MKEIKTAINEVYSEEGRSSTLLEQVVTLGNTSNNEISTLKKTLTSGSSQTQGQWGQTTCENILKEIGFKIINLHSRHDYTLKNFLNWYFTGSPQSAIYSSKVKNLYFDGNHHFEKEMNEIMIEANKKFQNLLSKHMVGELLCLTAIKEN